MRKPRQIIDNCSYHVTARANRQEFILNSSEMKDLFLTILKRAKKKYNFKIKNFCIMENHIHLIIKPLKNENISKIMQWILSVFAMRFNRKFNFIGHVWYDRFKSKVITSFNQYLKTFVYISENPIKVNLVETSDKYKYNGIYHIKTNNFDIIEKPKKKTYNLIIKNILNWGTELKKDRL